MCACMCIFESQNGNSALEVWGAVGLPSFQEGDEDKEAFKAHVETLFADVL